MTQLTLQAGLTRLLDDEKRRQIVPFAATVICHPEIFRILGPAVGPDGHISGGAHFWRTLPNLHIGLLTRTDGDYAEPMRTAHIDANVPTRLIGNAARWYLTMACSNAFDLHLEYVNDELMRRACVMAPDFDVLPDSLVGGPAELMRDFSSVEIAPEMKGAFWDVMAFPKVAEATDHPTREDVEALCSRHLPASFVRQLMAA